ncbi:MAG: YggT family protein [Parachlamydiales bacterium]|nr:YggT family protein [Parachlamydiales bacterium]
MAVFIYQVVSLLCTCYILMLMIRVVGSWFVSFRNSRFMIFIAQYTDPYLNIFRKIIPPIGGVLDLSPLLGFFVLRLIENFLLMLLS